MNLCDAYLIVSSRIVDSKVLRTAIQFEYFFSIKRLNHVNGECNVRNFRRFLFGMSPDIPGLKACVFTSDFKF